MSRLICQRRIAWLLLLLSCIFLFLVGKLVKIQLFRSAELTELAVQQRARGLNFFDGRGDIQDRHGDSLLDSRQELGLVAFPGLYRGWEEELLRLFPDLPELDRLKNPPDGPYPFWLTSSLARPHPALEGSVPGLVPLLNRQRYGPEALASHLVGYLNESQGRGVSGIEGAFDGELSRGQEVLLSAVVDGRDRLVPGLGYRLRRSRDASSNVVLSLDGPLQKELEAILDRHLRRGAAVVMDPWNGDLLALASRPNFQAHKLADYLDQDQQALINRALWEYQPGSLFKIVVAAAALEEKLVDLFDKFYCPGGITVEGLFIPCSRLHRGEEITLVEAFAHSCNTVFIQLALRLGPEKIIALAENLGLGRPTGIPVEERPGSLPSREDLASPRCLANMALGQGEVMTSPLQMAVVVSAVANGGRRVQPRLVLALTDDSGRRTRNYLPRRGEYVFSPATAHRLKYLMQAVVEQGTARSVSLPGEPVGAKTGTAQSGRVTGEGREILNYWIAGLYPLDQARAVIVVFADELKEGTVQEVFGKVVQALSRSSLWAKR